MDYIEAAALVAQEDADRSAAVGPYLSTVSGISRMVHTLGDLHADLPPDDRLHQVLHSLAFVWESVEAELLAAAARGPN